MDMPPDAAPPPPRLTMPAFWHEVAEGMFNLERGLPWTFWRMLTAPGPLIRDFVVRRDARIVRPVRWFLIGFSLAALVFGLVDGAAATREGFVDPSQLEESEDDQILWWVMSQAEWLLLIAVVPACATALRWAFAREQPNFAEMWVFSLYVAGQSLVVASALMLVDQAFELHELVLPAIPATILVFACLGYFTGPLPGRCARTLGAVVIAAVLVTAFLFGTLFSALAIARAFA